MDAKVSAAMFPVHSLLPATKHLQHKQSNEELLSGMDASPSKAQATEQLAMIKHSGVCRTVWKCTMSCTKLSSPMLTMADPIPPAHARQTTPQHWWYPSLKLGDQKLGNSTETLAALNA